MAVNYKYADQDLDLKNYIHNLNENLNSYIDYGVKNYGWNDGQVTQFRNSYDNYLKVLNEQLENGTNRLSTDVHGNIHDVEGLLKDGDDFYYGTDGKQIDKNTYDSLSARKQKKYSAFNGNRQFATYARNVLDTIVKHNKENQSAPVKFDPKQHGFIYWWKNIQNADGGEHLNEYLDLDPVNPETGKRERTNRMARASEYAKNYAEWLKNQNLNYDDSPISGEERISRLNNLSEKWGDKNWDSEDLIAASQAGIDSDWLNGFFTEDEHYKTPEQQQAAKQKAEAEKAEAEKKAQEENWNNEWRHAIDAHDQLYQQNRGSYYGNNRFDLGKYKIYDSDEAIGRDFTDLAKDANGNPDYERYLNEWIQNPFDKQKGVRAVSLLINKGIARQLENGTYYIRQKDDLDKGRALIYDPATGELYYDFSLNVPENLKRVQDDFRMKQNPDYKYNIYAAPSRKQGGTIEKLQLGGVSNLNQDIADARMKGFEERGKARGNELLKDSRTAKQQEAGERLINSKNENAQDQNSGFTAIEVGRAATILGDLTSMGLAFAPGVGSLASAAVGAASTTGNLALDLADDSVTGWEAFKNAAFGYGMDLVGAVPVFGATGKMAKVAKTAAKLANKVMPWLMASQALHAGEYYESWKKLLSTDGKVSVDDWKNIAASLQLIAGGAASLKRRSTFKKNDAKAIDNDKVAMDFIDKNGNKQTKLFMGEDAKAIREAQKSGKIEDLKKVTTDKFDDLKDLEINVQGSSSGLKIPFTKKSLWAKTGRPDVFNVKNPVNNKGVVDTSNPFVERGWNTPDVSAKDLKPVSNAANDSQIIADLRSKVEKNKARMPQLKKRVDKAKSDFESSKSAEPKNIDQKSQEYVDWKADNLKKRNILKQTKHLRDMNLYDLSRLRKGYRNNITPEGNAQFTLPNGQVVTRNWKDILAKSGIVFKKGGKFQDGGGINDVRHNLSWWEDMFNTDIKNYLSKQSFATDADKDTFIKNFNDRQQTWYNNKVNNINKGWTPGGKVFYTPEVWNYQGTWQNLGLNTGISQFNKSHADLHNTPKGFGDTEEGGWQDGYFGRQESIRNAGTIDEWKGHENELKAFQNQLAQLGLTYTPDKNGMYLLGKLSNKPTNPVTNNQPAQTTVVENNIVTNNNDQKGFSNVRRSLTQGDLTNIYGGARAIGAMFNNDRVTKMANNMARIVDLTDPFTFNRYVMSDLGAEQQGKDAAGQLYSRSSRPLTSDANAQAAAQFESANKGLEFINQGLRQSDTVARQSREQAWAQDKENATNIHQTAMDNRNELNSAARQISINNQLREKQKFDILNQFAQQKEFEAKQELQNKKDIADRIAMQDISDATRNNLKYFVPDIPDDELQAWELYGSGKEVPDNLKDALNRAYQKALQAKTRATREYYGIPENNWSNVRKIAKPVISNPTKYSESKKKGGTIEEKKELAKLRGRIKDYEIFHKNMNKDKDRHEKALDRIAKYKKK